MVCEIAELLQINPKKLRKIAYEFLDDNEMIQYEQFKRNNINNRLKSVKERAYENKKMLFRNRIIMARARYLAINK